MTVFVCMCASLSLVSCSCAVVLCKCKLYEKQKSECSRSVFSPEWEREREDSSGLVNTLNNDRVLVSVALAGAQWWHHLPAAFHDEQHWGIFTHCTEHSTPTHPPTMVHSTRPHSQRDRQTAHILLLNQSVCVSEIFTLTHPHVTPPTLNTTQTKRTAEYISSSAWSGLRYGSGCPSLSRV